MSKITIALSGLILGASFAIAITASPWVAPLYSQAIYDCGVRVASGVTARAIQSFQIPAGHKYGMCIDGGSTVNVSDTITVVE